MNCQIHPELPATAYCRTCGKPICDECRRDAYGTVFCAEHAPAPATASAPPPAGPPAPVGARPTGYIYSDVFHRLSRHAYGPVFCADPAPAPATASAPPPAGPPAPVGARPTGYIYSDVSPGLAFFLGWIPGVGARSEEHTSELQSLRHLVCRLLLEKKHTR